MKNSSKDALTGAINCLPIVGGVIASYLQIAKNNRETYLEMDFYRKLLASIYGIKDLQPKDIKSFYGMNKMPRFFWKCYYESH